MRNVIVFRVTLMNELRLLLLNLGRNVISTSVQYFKVNKCIDLSLFFLPSIGFSGSTFKKISIGYSIYPYIK